MNYRVKEKKNFALALLSVMGLSVDVRDVEELELDGYNRQELEAILADLQHRLKLLRLIKVYVAGLDPSVALLPQG